MKTKPAWMWSWIRRKHTGSMVLAIRQYRVHRVAAQLKGNSPLITALELQFAFELKRRGHNYAPYTKYSELGSS